MLPAFLPTGLLKYGLRKKYPAFRYIPPASEFRFGGYEVDEAHRYYGLPMSFAPGSAEALAGCAIALATDN